MFSRFALAGARSMTAKKLGAMFVTTMAPVVHTHKYTALFGIAGITFAILALEPSEEFDDLDCLNHIYTDMPDCSNLRRQKEST